MKGYQILARSIREAGCSTLFFLMGGPMLEFVQEAKALGIDVIDVRHEQAAAMMAHAWARVSGRVGVCVASSGPGVINLATGVAAANADSAPILALGGASPMHRSGTGAFQEVDQVGVMLPITRKSDRITSPSRIPDFVAAAFRAATKAPGPVYLDCPSDILAAEVEAEVAYAQTYVVETRRAADPRAVERAAELVSQAERPIVAAGSGVLWGKAWPEFREFVEESRLPFFTTPQARGIVPEDHPLAFLGARSFAFRNADLVLAVGTRANFMFNFFSPPRFARQAKLIMVNTDPEEIGRNRPSEVAIVADAGAALQQLREALLTRKGSPAQEDWLASLGSEDERYWKSRQHLLHSDSVPIHPLRLCHEIRDVLDRDAILVVDGHVILNYARQSIPTYEPGHRLNSGPFGCMGVGLPFGIGAKVAKPDKQVLVLHGDGSFGMNAMELDTAVRHDLPVVVVISNNGGWTNSSTEDDVVGRYLGFTRYEKVAEALGCHGEYVESPAEIRPALERALEAGIPACVNVVTDPAVKAETQTFAAYRFPGGGS